MDDAQSSDIAPITAEGLKASREALGLTQNQLGNAIGVHGNTIARWERGLLQIDKPILVARAVRDLEQRTGQRATAK